MKKITTLLIALILTFSFIGCNEDDLETIEVKGRLVSEVTGDPIPNVPVIGLSQSSRGTGLFSSNYDIDRQFTETDTQGFFNLSVGYEDYNSNWIWVFKGESNVCTEFLNTERIYPIPELDGNELTVEVRKLYPMEIKVKNVNPFDEEDSIYIHLIELMPNNPYNRLFTAENFGVENQPRNPDQVGVIDNLYWVGENVDSVLNGLVQEDAEIMIYYSVMKNGELISYSSELIPTVNEGTTYYEINY